MTDRIRTVDMSDPAVVLDCYKKLNVAYKELKVENEKLRAALIAVYRLMDMDGSDIDCCDLQDKLIKHGVLVEYIATEPCCDICACEEYGPEFPMKCYRLNEDLRAAAAALKETGSE